MEDIVNELRNNVLMFLSSNQYETAIFWVELLLNRTKDTPSDLYLYTKALYHNGQFRRAINLIEQHKLANKYLTFRLLAARSYFAIKDCINAVQILDNQSSPNSINTPKLFMISAISANVDSHSGFGKYDAQELELFGHSLTELENNCYLLLGDIYNQMENRDTAIEYYKLAVKTDVKCYAAIQKLYSGNMITLDEARAFLSSLDYSQCKDEKIAQIVKNCYEDLFNTECAAGNEIKCPKVDIALDNHHSCLFNCATRYYNNSQFKKAYELTTKILKDDTHNPNVITLHAAILTELKFNNELFSFASGLIDNYPDKKESWYAIGCYYLATNRYSLARLQFLKATEIDKFFGFAWLAVGHTYSMDNERDQALAAYCSASQAIKGCHIPILYIALEYSLSNNTSVSINYLQEAMKIGSHDPYCWHEKGFIAFNNKNYQDALKFCLNAYESHRNESSDITGFWEPLLNNIAHCYYKLGDYDKSLEYFERALGKKPKNPSTLASMALVYTRKGDISKAVNYLNRVLGLDRENNFARSLMMTMTNMNCKYSNKLLVDDCHTTKDIFKASQFVSRESSYEKFTTLINYELSRHSDKDDSKMSNDDKEMKLF